MRTARNLKCSKLQLVRRLKKVELCCFLSTEHVTIALRPSTKGKEKKMHNGVQNYNFKNHKIEITKRSTLIAYGGSRGIHASTDFEEFELKIDGETIKPPSGLTSPFITNWRSTGFDNPKNASLWAEHLIDARVSRQETLSLVG